MRFLQVNSIWFSLLLKAYIFITLNELFLPWLYQLPLLYQFMTVKPARTSNCKCK